MVLTEIAEFLISNEKLLASIAYVATSGSMIVGAYALRQSSKQARLKNGIEISDLLRSRLQFLLEDKGEEVRIRFECGEALNTLEMLCYYYNRGYFKDRLLESYIIFLSQYMLNNETGRAIFMDSVEHADVFKDIITFLERDREFYVNNPGVFHAKEIRELGVLRD